jgi:hypothetical protein
VATRALSSGFARASLRSFLLCDGCVVFGNVKRDFDKVMFVINDRFSVAVRS